MQEESGSQLENLSVIPAICGMIEGGIHGRGEMQLALLIVGRKARGRKSRSWVSSHKWVVDLRSEVAMLTLFGSIAVAIMLFSYWLEPRSKWFILVFAGGCAATAAYTLLEEVYPITAIEALWALVALQRFLQNRRKEALVRPLGDPE